ncbi:MAG: FAD-dependent oxidoreductase [Coprothermobacterota bacterium]|nr:FAD-dependent oxidoreductase [Coprothermobacterota bacterium]
MIIRPDAVLQDSYPVIVIGSGLAGLTAAALLAKRGLGVLLLEHHYLPGGMCTTLRRHDFSFDTGTALIYGFGERGFNSHRFVMNELEEEIEIIQHQALLVMHFNGKRIIFWPDLDRFLEELCAAFPGHDEELHSLYSYLYGVYAKVIAREPVIVPPTEIPPAQNLRTLLRHPLALLQTVRMLSTSTESVIRRFVRDPELLAFFDKLTSTYCYCTIKETPAILAATMFVDNHIGGAYYPARSPQILASKLERALEMHGGQAYYRARVEEILIEQGKAVGVRLVDGLELRAERVVANATVWNLYGGLIRHERLKPGRLEWARRQIPTYASMVLYLGVEASVIPEGTYPVEMLIADPKGVNEGDVTVYISSLDDPSIAPPGMHAITVIAPSPTPWPSPWDPAYRSPRYMQRKQETAEKLLNQLEERFPGLRKAIRVMEVGTPATIERYTLKNGGAVGGPKQCIGQEIMKRLHARSEWKNLYLCGDSTVMGMGAPAVTVSGVGAANLVLRDAGLPEYRHRSFSTQAVHLVKGAALAPLPPSGEPLDLEGAMRLARECQYCQQPGCWEACPAKLDIGNAMRRLEAGNVVGAARSLRENNPLAEICGHLCGPNPPCEKACNRNSFSDQPVRIANLQAWICREAGKEGWALRATSPNGHRTELQRALVLGAGPAGLTCAHYLARLGIRVDLWDQQSFIGGGLRQATGERLPIEVLRRELEGLDRFGVSFQGGKCLPEELPPEKLTGHGRAIFLATGAASRQSTAAWLGLVDLTIDPETMALAGKPGFYAGGGLVREDCSAVQSVADGRTAAVSIHHYLGNQKLFKFGLVSTPCRGRSAPK